MAINKDGSIRKRKSESVHQRWLKENGYVMTGSQLSGMIGVSMQKIKLAMNVPELEFPKPVQNVVSRQRKVLCFKRSEIEEFMSRVNLKNTRLERWRPKQYRSKHVSHGVKSFDQKSALSFLIGRTVTGIDCGSAHYE